MRTSESEPGRLARRVFDETVEAFEPGCAVRRAVRVVGDGLKIFDDEFDLSARGPGVYSVAIGKAAGAMAAALDEILGARLAGGIVSAPPLASRLTGRWRAFEGGHPLPNAASLAAGRTCFDLLRRADEEGALVVFLVSGGGSAMLEWPRDEGSTTLDDWREANRVLITCGASIAEVNAVRRAFSALKGGGLSRLAPRAAQVTLIVSDTRAGEEHAVASGPTLAPPARSSGEPDAREIVERYQLAALLPTSILQTVERHWRDEAAEGGPQAAGGRAGPLRRHHVLLDNAGAVRRAADIARSQGCAVEVAEDIADQHVAEGAPLLVSRLLGLRERVGGAGVVCVVSGGEFSCPARGGGAGGRNSETALRCALELEARVNAESPSKRPRFVVFSAGTDGVDGNSPAAGALCDETTARRARALGRDPQKFLDASDAYNLFDALGDAVLTGPTGTNVRDLRILVTGER